MPDSTPPPETTVEGTRGERLLALLNRGSLALLLALPAALVVYFGFQAGGFFEGQPAFIAFLLAMLLVLQTTLPDRPFAGLTRPLAVAILALTGFAGWTLASGSWSSNPGLAVTEFVRAELYLLVLLLMVTVSGSPNRLRWVLRLLLIGIGVVVACSLFTRLLPEVWETTPNIAENRLSYPVTYWNTLGLLSAFGIVIAAYATTSEREPRRVSVLAAMLVPVLAVTLLFTFSRGAILVAALGLAVLFVLGRPRFLPTGFLAVVPPTAIAVVSAYGADHLTSVDPRTAAAVAEGKDVGLVVLLCVVAAGVLRLVAARFDTAMQLRQLGLDRRWRLGTSSVGFAVILVALLALNVPSAVSRQYDRFVDGDSATAQVDVRDRLTDPGNNGRLDHWHVAMDSFREDRLKGTGAGSYEAWWNRERPEALTVKDAHSLYVEVLAELGLVGLLLLVAAVGTLLVVAFMRVRGPDRTTYAAAAALLLIWAAHAGIDWDWEMPVITVVFFGVGAAALARRRPPSGPTIPERLRPVVALSWTLLAVPAVLLAIFSGELDGARASFEKNDCVAGREQALSAMSTLASRSESYEILAWCNLRRDFPRGAIDAFDRAIDEDSENWRLYYGLAVARGAAGLDPRPATAQARRLNPKEPLVANLVFLFDTDDPRKWREGARDERDTAINLEAITSQ